ALPQRSAPGAWISRRRQARSSRPYSAEGWLRSRRRARPSAHTDATGFAPPRPRRMCSWQLDRQAVGPSDILVGAHKPDAADPGLDLVFVSGAKLRIDRQLDPEHQLLALLGGLDRLRRELRLCGDKRDL